MNNFFTLTKVFFLSGFNVNKRKKNQKSAFSLFILTLVLFAFVSLTISFGFISKLDLVGGTLESVLGIMLFMSFMMNFILSVTQVQSIIFNTKDYEFLESLPVSKTAIISSKLFAFYLINVSEDLALIVPSICLYLAFGGAITSGLVALLAAIFICVIPIMISAIIGALSALISSKSKHSNLINLIFSILFFGLTFIGYMFIMYSNTAEVANTLNKLFIFKWINEGILGNYIYLLYYLAFCIGAFILVCLFISLIYKPVNAWLKFKNNHTDYDSIKKETNASDLDIDKVLLKKEWNMISKKPQWLLNSILGGVFCIVIGVIAIMFPSLFVSGSSSDDGVDPLLIQQIMSYMVPGLCLMMFSIATPVSSSISFEGRNGYELLRSYPIDSRKIIKAKFSISLIIGLIESVIVSLVLIVLLLIKGIIYPDLLIGVIIYPILAMTYTTIMGTITGLKWPKLDYENEAQVLKNSASVNFLMLFSFLPAFILFGVSYAGTLIFTYAGLEFMKYVILGVISLIYIIVCVIFYSVIKKKGPKLFNNIIKR